MEEIGDVARDIIQELGGVEVVLVLNLLLTIVVLALIKDVRSKVKAIAARSPVTKPPAAPPSPPPHDEDAADTTGPAETA